MSKGHYYDNLLQYDIIYSTIYMINHFSIGHYLVILRSTISYNTLCYTYDKTHFDRAIVQLSTLYHNTFLKSKFGL